MITRQRRILHFVDSGGIYGAERVILNVSRQMLKLADMVPVVGCIVSTSDESSDLYDAAKSMGIEAIKVPISNYSLLRDLPRACDQLRDARIDLIHSHGYKPSVFGDIISRRARIPIIATCHLWFEPTSGPLKQRLMVAIEKRLYRHFPAVIAVSEPISVVLAEHGVPDDRRFVVPNGVEVPDRVCPDDLIALRRELGLTPDHYVVLNAGRLTRQKAQWLLIGVAARLRVQVPDLRIIIVGEGHLRRDLERQVSTLGVSDQVRILGFRTDIDALMQMADVFILPSLDEGMPMALLEAAAARLPVVVTDVGDIAKLVAHERSGLIVPRDDMDALATALLRLRGDPAFAASLGSAVHEAMALGYSSQAMTRRYIAVYESVLAVRRNVL